eukprot:249703-Alexandrium_andersonii.AAC.1
MCIRDRPCPHPPPASTSTAPSRLHSCYDHVQIMQLHVANGAFHARPAHCSTRRRPLGSPYTSTPPLLSA